MTNNHNAVNQGANGAANNALPVINGRKTLLIGLGSTGAKVCNQILERFTWTYGSPTAVPWVSCMVLETEDIEGTRLISPHTLKLEVNKDDYASLIENPHLYHSQIGFADWNIPDLTAGADSIEHGANNIRILGRLALLFPNNFLKVRGTISEALIELENLTSEQATDTFAAGLDKGSNEAARIILSNDIYVYVVGTLCGGTASGAFLDLGYMLRKLTGHKFKTTGLFLLPSGVEENELRTGNAYAGLVELNHFSSDTTRYKAQLPHQQGKITHAAQGTSPYQFLYLVQGRGGGDEQYAKLITTTADYIYSDAVGGTAMTRDGDRTNITNFFKQRDYWGATQKFFTFGLSVIEFPYAKVAKACALRLTHKGFDQLMTGTPLTERQCDHLLASVPLSRFSSLKSALLNYQGHPLDVTIENTLQSEMKTVRESDEAMDLILSKMNAAFDGSVPHPYPQLPVRVVPQTIEENLRPAKQQLQDEIRTAVQKMLAADSETFGLIPTKGFLKALEAALLAAKEESVTDASYSSAVEKVKQAQQQVSKCRRSCWVRRSLGRHINEFHRACSNLYTHRLQIACAAALQDIYDEAIDLVAHARIRLENTNGGMLAEVEKLTAEIDNFYKRTDVPSGATKDGWERCINGLELYDPPSPDGTGGTVEHEYWATLREYKSQHHRADKVEVIEAALARGVVAQAYLPEALAQLLTSPDLKCRYDTKPRNASANDVPRAFGEAALLKFAYPARSAFVALKERSIVDRLLNRPDLAKELITTAAQSNLLLDWRPGHPRYFEPAGNKQQKSYAYVFYNSADPRAADFHEQLVGARILTNGRGERSMEQKHQIFFLREQGAFSLGTVENLKDELDSSWRHHYLNPPGLASFHARGDVDEWITWSRVDEQDRKHLRALFILGVALDVIQFVSANEYRFRYQKKSAADAGVTTMPRDLDEAAQKIRKDGIKHDIELRIKEWRDTNGDIALINRLAEFLQVTDEQGNRKQCEAENKFLEGGHLLKAVDVEAYLLNIVLADRDLEAEWFGFFKDEHIKSYQQDRDGEPAYYCPHCEQKLGYDVNSLYTLKQGQDGMVRVRECSYCQKPL